MITRRTLLRAGGAGLFLAGSTAAYAGLVEPGFRLVVTRHDVRPANWPAGFRLRLAVLADLHACEPWMSAERVAGIAAVTNGLAPDAVLLLGDYTGSHPFVSRPVPPDAWASALATLRAPLGVHAVLGNHDWWDDPSAQARRAGPTFARIALERAGIGVLENEAVRVFKSGRSVWFAGLGDQIAFPRTRGVYTVFNGVDDLAGTLAQVTDDAPVVLLAHEPDIFPDVPGRVALTVSGHTHGGQVRLFGHSPRVPSAFGNRYAYGHVVEEGRHLVVSGGLGCSIMPVRLGVPPEIVLIEIGPGDPVNGAKVRPGLRPELRPGLSPSEA